MRRISIWAKVLTSLPLILGAGMAVPSSAATLEVGPDKTFVRPSQAAAAAHDGDRVFIAPDTYADCAVWKASRLTIDGAGPDSTVITGAACAGKGLFIIQGSDITVRGLTLTGAHVADFNGAGIRAEGGDLTVDHVRFVNNEDGLLAGALPGVTITVRDSEFLGNGTCAGAGGCAHGIYVGRIAALRVEGSRFSGTRSGHHIKSRAQRTEVVGCVLEDGAGGTSSFAVDAPNGGALVLRDDRIEKGPDSENHTAAVMIGEEGVTQPTPEILVQHTMFRVDGSFTAYLVDNRTTTAATLRANTLQGNARALHGPGSVK